MKPKKDTVTNCTIWDESRQCYRFVDHTTFMLYEGTADGTTLAEQVMQHINAYERGKYNPMAKMAVY